MKKYILQGRKDAIKQDLLPIYEFTKDEGQCKMGHRNKITGEKTLETGTLLADGRVLVEITTL